MRHFKNKKSADFFISTESELNKSDRKNDKKSSVQQYYSFSCTEKQPVASENVKPFFQRTWFIIVMLLYFSPVGIFLMWYFKEWNPIIKVMVSLFFTVYFTAFCGAISNISGL